MVRAFSTAYYQDSIAAKGGYTISEQEALARVLAGDRDAYAVIVDLYRRYIFAVVLPIVKIPADAEDLVQDVFIRAYEKLSSYQGGSFKAWLGQIAVRAAIDHWRKLKRRADAPLDAAVALHERTAVSLDDRLTLTGLLASLSTQQQQAIQLYYYQGFSYREIATRLGVAEKTVESLLYRARGHLRHEWQNASEGGSA